MSGMEKPNNWEKWYDLMISELSDILRCLGVFGIGGLKSKVDQDSLERDSLSF